VFLSGMGAGDSSFFTANILTVPLYMFFLLRRVSFSSISFWGHTGLMAICLDMI
jgi:hypothetical protein